MSGELGHAVCVHDRFTITAAHVPSTDRMLIYHERHLQWGPRRVHRSWQPGPAPPVPPIGGGVVSEYYQAA
jgi:hypothetical protein